MSDHYGRALSDACSGYAAFKPPNRVSISQGAKQNLKIKQTGGSTDAWDATETPYMVKPMDTLASRVHESVVFVGPARTGKTAGLLLGWMSHNIVNDPGDMLFIQMSKEKAREFSKTDVQRALRNSPNLSEMRTGRRDDSNTHDEMFKHGMWLRIAWPTVGNVSGSTYRYVAITDIDRIENADNVDGEGPLFDLAKKRTTTFMSRGMALVESSPGKPILDPMWKPATAHEAPPVAGVLGLYNRSDRQRWYWACPHCEERFEASPGLALFNLPSFDELQAEARTANIPKLAAHYARIVCPNNGCIITPDFKRSMNQGGIWLPDGQRFVNGEIVGDPMESSTAGFWLGGVAAAFQSWKSILENYFTGVRDYALTGSEEKLKTTTNTDQGAPYMARALAENLAGTMTPQERAVNMPRYVVPDGTRALLASVDVQGGTGARFVVQVHAVGPYLEQWLVDRFDITESARPGMGREFAPIDPAGYAEDWDQITEKVLRATWRTSDSTKEMQVLLATVDTGGEGKGNGGEGVSHNAYAWYRRVRKLGLAARVMLYKGSNLPTAPVVRESLVGGKDGKSADVPLYSCNPHLLSDAVDAGLRRDQPGPGYIHFPKPHHPTTNPDGWLSQAFFDELHAEVRNANGIWQKVRKRNESFDLCRMIRAGILRLGLDKITDWNVVPPSLAPLAQNSSIITRQQRQQLQANTPIQEPQEVRVLQRQPRPRRHAQARL